MSNDIFEFGERNYEVKRPPPIYPAWFNAPQMTDLV